MAGGLKFGFSSDVVNHNIQLLIDNGRTPDKARQIAENYASASKKKLVKAKEKREIGVNND